VVVAKTIPVVAGSINCFSPEQLKLTKLNSNQNATKMWEMLYDEICEQFGGCH
jgi:hypothetical protein